LAFWELVNAGDNLEENGLEGYDSYFHHCAKDSWNENDLWERRSSLD